MIYTAIIAVCLLTDPTDCRVYEQPLTQLSSSPSVAFVEAQAWVAQWLEAHPDLGSRMTAVTIRLETNVEALWQRWMNARLALMEQPTPARFDACLEAFKPYFIKVVGLGWQEKIGEAMAAELAYCNEIMTRGTRREGRHG